MRRENIRAGVARRLRFHIVPFAGFFVLCILHESEEKPWKFGFFP